MSGRLLEVSAVANIVGLAAATLAKRRLSGDGPPFVKLGARVLYPERELYAWIEAQPRFETTAEVSQLAAREAAR
jgi:predicted DNA-binding transcriptional regulator AlpA